MESMDYMSLVRRQLEEYGYDRSAVPDEVLQQFLQEFEQRLVVDSEGNECEPEASALDAGSERDRLFAEASHGDLSIAEEELPYVEPLRYPTALDTSEGGHNAHRPQSTLQRPAPARAGRPRATAMGAPHRADTQNDRQEQTSLRARGKPLRSPRPAALAETALPAGHSASARASLYGRERREAFVAPRGAVERVSPRAASGCPSAAVQSVRQGPPLGSNAPPATEGFTTCADAHVDTFAPAHAHAGGYTRAAPWRHGCVDAKTEIPTDDSENDAAAANVPRGGARAPPRSHSLSSCSSRLYSSGCVPYTSTSALIRAVDTTPRTPKCDPVALHARRAAGWKNDPFLLHSPRRSVPVYSPAPATRQQSRRRAPPSYVVPTAKRRDDVVWETRMRMRRQASEPAMPRRQRKPLERNSFVPPNEKRRDGLRWQVRAEMAWAH